MIRGAKGDRGEQGLQGPEGKPCTRCVCMDKIHKSEARYISSEGKRSLSDSDKLVVIDCAKSCTLTLPLLVASDREEGDTYYYPVKIKVMCNAGVHTIVARDGNRINLYSRDYPLDKRVTYKIISTPSGDWLVFSK